MEEMVTGKIRLVDPARVRDLFGIHDEHLRKLEKIFEVRLVVEDGEIEVRGGAGPVALSFSRDYLSTFNLAL